MNREMARKPLAEIDGEYVYEDEVVTWKGHLFGLLVVVVFIVGLGVLEAIVR